MKGDLQGCSKYKTQKVKAGKDSASDSKKKSGRPKGSKNKNRRDVELSPYLQFVQGVLSKVLGVARTVCQPRYLVFDGELGNNFGVQMASRLGLHLISKLRRDAELYLPWEGEYSGRGRKRIYGERLQVGDIPERYQVSSEEKDGVRTEVFQIRQARHKKFPDALNVVIIRKTILDEQRVGHVILFSSDNGLEWEKLVDYYSLRFQIEFDFRDAKQYWGLEDFMVIREQRVRNSASFSFFMINLSRSLITEYGGRMGKSVHDLKIWFLARKQVLDVLKLCGENSEEVFIQELIRKISAEITVNTV